MPSIFLTALDFYLYVAPILYDLFSSSDGNRSVSSDSNGSVIRDNNSSVSSDGNGSVSSDGNGSVSSDRNGSISSDGDGSVSLDDCNVQKEGTKLESVAHCMACI